jgi:sigma-B regulation protein RsbU (phosphoserine phosphatase)
MPTDPSIIEHVRALQGPGSRNAELIKQVIESWAARQDYEAGNQLLRSLVLKYADAEKKLYRLNRELVDRQQRLDEDLAAAAEIQSSLLPQDTAAFEQLDIAWAFEPSTHIAGDIFNVIRLDDRCCAAYALDVCGHGVPAAMVAVSVCQNLQPSSALIRTPDRMSASGQSPRSPADVLRALDLEYPFERFSNFFTVVYLLIDTAAGTLTCSNAGHPQPFILRKGGGIQRLKRGGPVIGLRTIRSQADREIVFSEERVRLTPGDRVLLYTDGLTEYQNAAGELYGSARFLARLEALRERPLADMVEAVRLSLREFGGGANPADDMTLLGIELKEDRAKGRG